MKLAEARKIVGKMIGWGFVNHGIISPEDRNYPEPITESLETLILANKIVERANKRNQKYADKRMAEVGHARCKRSMTIADRGIAAIYVAANFRPDNLLFEKADTIAMHGNSVLLCVDRRSIQNPEDEE